MPAPIIIIRKWNEKLTKRITLLILFFALGLTVEPTFAGALDWLSKRKESKSEQSRKTVLQESLKVDESKAMDLPGFFQSEPQEDVKGNFLSLYKFVENHWLHSKNSMETVAKSIEAKIPAKKCGEITQKLYVIGIQAEKESLKTSASGIEKIEQSSKNLENLLNELNRIITAPREETMANLQKTISQLQRLNGEMAAVTKSHIAGAESLIAMGDEAFQTLELIPSLSISSLDYFIQGSKQLMKQIQSNNETLKGLLLNILASCDQLVANLDLMTNTIKTTLKYSDHFAFRQFPLINLPVPSREKLFSQLSVMQNIRKGIDNTLQIGNSHVKNSAQQFTHLFDGITAKIKDSLQYLTAVDMTSGSLPQISVYALNQVSGLYQRTKEKISEMRLTMAKNLRNTNVSGNIPKIALENDEEEKSRRAKLVAEEKLPLFLLGGKSNEVKSSLSKKPNIQTDSAKPKMTVLYSEKEPAESPSQGLRPEEMEILRKELNEKDFFLPLGKNDSAEGDDSLNLVEKKEEELKNLANFNPLPDYPSGKFEDYSGNLSAKISESEKNDLELLPMESNSLENTGDLIPMLKMDEPLNSPEK